MKVNTLFNNAQRNLLWLQLQSRYYLAFALAAFIVFFLFGAVPLGLQVKEKLALIKEMNLVNATLSDNNAKLSVAQDRFMIFGPFIHSFRQHLPNVYSQQDYLINVNGAAAQSNFYLDRFIFSQYDLEKGGETFSIGFEGVGDIRVLTKSIENMNGALTIDNVAVSTGSLEDGVYKVVMQVRIFTL